MYKKLPWLVPTLFFSNLLHLPLTYAQTSRTGNQLEQVGTETTDQISSMVGFILSQFPLWITALIVMVASFVLARFVKGSVENKMVQEGLEEEHQEIRIVAGRTAHAGVLIVGITVGLKIAGLDLTPVIAAGAFGIGFALQDLIMNFLAGVMILASRHYTIGDVIEVNGTIGKIVEIQTRATIMKAFDGTKVIVPNAELFKNKVVSKTSNPFRRLQFVMGVGYEADLKQTMDLTLNTVKTIPGVLISPKPSVIFYEWGDYSINFKINVWIDSKGGQLVKVKNKVMMALSEAYNNSGINIPYPIQTVQLEKADEELNSTASPLPKTQVLSSQRPAIMTTPMPIRQNVPASEIQLDQNNGMLSKQNNLTASLQPQQLGSQQSQLQQSEFQQSEFQQSEFQQSELQQPESRQPEFKQQESQQIEASILSEKQADSTQISSQISSQTPQLSSEKASLPVSPKPTINSDAPAWLQKALVEQANELKSENSENSENENNIVQPQVAIQEHPEQEHPEQGYSEQEHPEQEHSEQAYPEQGLSQIESTKPPEEIKPFISASEVGQST